MTLKNVPINIPAAAELVLTMDREQFLINVMGMTQSPATLCTVGRLPGIVGNADGTFPQGTEAVLFEGFLPYSIPLKTPLKSLDKLYVKTNGPVTLNLLFQS